MAYSKSVASLHHDIYLLLMQEKMFLFKASKRFLKSIFQVKSFFLIEGLSVVL